MFPARANGFVVLSVQQYSNLKLLHKGVRPEKAENVGGLTFIC